MLLGCLGKYYVRTVQAVAIQLFVAPESHQQRAWIAVGVTRDSKDELAVVQLRVHRDLTDQGAGAAGVVNVGVGSAQGRP